MRIVIEVENGSATLVNVPASPAPMSANMADVTPRERILLALVDPRFTYRTLDALVDASGVSEAETLRLLESLGNSVFKTSAGYYTVKSVGLPDSFELPKLGNR